MNDHAVTHSINVYKKPKKGTTAFLCRAFPKARAILERLPVALQEKLFDPYVNYNERIVEHPWILINLGLHMGSILDVGCCYSSLSIELASLGHEVWGVDINPYGFSHPNFRFVRGDICEVSLPDGYYDRILAVSCVEHFGLEVYGGQRDADKDRNAVKRMHRLLKMGGKIVVTVPFGRLNITPEYRVYDLPALRELMSPFRIEKECIFTRNEGGGWIPFRGEGALYSPGSDDRGVQAVALVMATKESAP